MAVKKPAAKKAPVKKPAVKKGTAQELKSLEKKIGKVPKFFKELTTKEPEMFNLVMRFEQHIWDDGKLTKKTKKLIPSPLLQPCVISTQSGHSWPVQKTSGSPRQRSKRRSASRSSSPACRHTCTARPSSMK